MINLKKKLKSPLSIFLITLMILSLAGSVLYLVVTLGNRLADIKILNDGLRVYGSVVDKGYIIRGSSAQIQITFLDREENTVNTYLSRDEAGALFSKLQVGDSIEMAYDAVNPKKNIPTELKLPPLWPLLLKASLILSIGIIIFFIWVRTIYRGQKLLQNEFSIGRQYQLPPNWWVWLAGLIWLAYVIFWIVVVLLYLFN